MQTRASPTFGELLRRHRLAAGLSQEDLAERAGLSRRGISDLERGVKSRPHAHTVHLLAEALGLAGASRAAFEAARARGAAVAPADDGPARRGEMLPPLVGRAQELALLGRHLAGEGPPLLLLAGEPGIGKTRLLQAAVPHAVAQGWRVLAGGCQRRGGHEPYAPLLAALQGYIRARPLVQLRADLEGCAWLVRLLPELATGPIEPLPAWTLSPEQERRLMVAAVVRFLTNVAGPSGTLLVLDDLHWAGTDALDVLTALARVAPEVPLRIAGAYRDTEVQPQHPLAVMLADLAHARLAAQRLLGPLSPEEAGQVVATLLPEEGEDTTVLREQVVRRTGGVPFYLVSCAQAARLGELDGSSPTVPWDVAQGIRQRMATLPQAAQEVLGAAAVAVGRIAHPALLAAVVDYPEREVLAALAAAMRARLLEEADGAHRFAHDLVREVVEADLGTARRMVLHRRMAEALEQLPGRPSPPLLAYHYLRAGEQARAAVHLERAGDQARAQGALADAEFAYRELVGCLDGLERAGEAAAAREKLGAVLGMQCRYDDALGVLEQAATAYGATSDREGLWRVTAAIGFVHGKRNTPDEGLQRLLAALANKDLSEPSHGMALLLRTLAGLRLFDAQYREMLAVADQAMAMARALGDDRLLVESGCIRVTALIWCGQEEEALHLAEALCRLAETIGAVGELADLHHFAGLLCEILGEYARGMQHATEGLRHAEQSGHLRLVQDNHKRLGTIYFFSGDWEQAREHYARAQAITSQAAPYHPLLLDLGRLCLAEGAWDLARSCLQQSSSISGRSKLLIIHMQSESCLAELDILTGQPGAAYARLLPLQEQAGREAPVVATFLLSRLAWAALELGRLEEATLLLDQALGRQRAHGYRSALVDTLRVQGLLHRRLGQLAPAVRAIEEGLSLARQIGYPYGEARLLHAYGQLHAEAGGKDPARKRLEAALATFRRLGARKDLEQTEQLLAALS